MSEITLTEAYELKHMLESLQDENRMDTSTTIPKEKSGNLFIAGERMNEGLTNAQMDYHKELMDFENAVKAGYDGERFKPHASVEGGTDTIGYGHKLTGAEIRASKIYGINYKEGLTDEMATYIMRKDVEVAEEDADRLFPGYADVSSDVYKLLTDMSYNMGGSRLSKFKETKRYYSDKDTAGFVKEVKNSIYYKKDLPNNEARYKYITALLNNIEATDALNKG